MLTLKDFKKVLVSYYRKPDKYATKLIIYQGIDTDGSSIAISQAVLTYEKGEKKGVLVAIGPGIIGWSLCNFSAKYWEKEVFDKKLGLHIALNRAEAASKMSTIEKAEYYDNVPSSMQESFEEMLNRSYRYFQVSEE